MTTLALLAVALGTLTLDSNLTTGNAFRGEIESVEGQELLERSFPAGASAPTTVIVTDPEQLDAVIAAAEQSPAVAEVGPVQEAAPGALFNVTLTEDPFSQEGFALIEPLRDELRALGRRRRARRRSDSGGTRPAEQPSKRHAVPRPARAPRRPRRSSCCCSARCSARSC